MLRVNLLNPPANPWRNGYIWIDSEACTLSRMVRPRTLWRVFLVWLRDECTAALRPPNHYNY